MKPEIPHTTEFELAHHYANDVSGSLAILKRIHQAKKTRSPVPKVNLNESRDRFVDGLERAISLNPEQTKGNHPKPPKRNGRPSKRKRFP